ncbi:MAG: stage 0 sporulation family protein, partial [Clostridia bacterium]|nr:stage 0 sporulation family protein [Clostridia bacterium]
MAEVVSIKFNEGGKAYYFDPDNAQFTVGEAVIVETANGISLGTVSRPRHTIDDEKVVLPLKKIIRRADGRDMQKLKENKQKEQVAFKICNDKISDHKLDMKLVNVEYSFDCSKITFFFTAEGRVDFRQLVKDLASHFHARIELRQIGVRDEAKMLGGIGICGQPYCCKRFLDDFQPVSIKMAKEQGLSLNPTKISGSCGRLMCCLKYEQDSYEHLIKITPPLGATV